MTNVWNPHFGGLHTFIGLLIQIIQQSLLWNADVFANVNAAYLTGLHKLIGAVPPDLKDTGKFGYREYHGDIFFIICLFH